MDPQRWQRTRALFELAVDEPRDRWAQILESACPEDPSLVEDAMRLLDADATADGGISRVAAHAPDLLDEMSAAADHRLVDTWIGRHLGAWRIVRAIGHGGMGVVYLAERDDGEFRQQAALKMLRGTHDPIATARFVAERQILAALEHAHIARLLDGGSTDASGPWFALDYVDGVAITAWCNAQRLGIAQRLHLFLDICSAVAYAHERLIVHRDLKPANILVDNAGRVTLLDFGIAKLLDASSAQTGTAVRAFTPEYAAPEQIRGETITTAVDIYALGVVLYELLTGHRPYRVKEPSPAAYERAVLEQDVTRPSAAIPKGGSKAARTADGAGQPALLMSGLAAGALRARLRGDLDAIVLKALRKEPAHRYGSVRELELDIRAALAHRPVTARRGGWRYVAGRFLRRNTLAVGMASLALVALIIGLVAALWQAHEARSQRDAAQQSLAFMTELFQNGDPGNSESGDLTVRHLLDEGVRTIRYSLTNATRARSDLLLAMASAYLGLELVDSAVPLIDEASSIAQKNDDVVAMAKVGVQRCRVLNYIPDYAGCARVAQSLEGRLDRRDPQQAALVAELIGARILGLRAEDKYEALVDNAQDALSLLSPAPEHLRLRSELTGMVVRALGQLVRYDEAEAVMRSFIDELRAGESTPPRLLADSLDNLSSILVESGRRDEALELNREAVQGYEKIYGVDNPINAAKMNNLAVGLYYAGHLEEAIGLMRRIVKIQESRGDQSSASSANLGNLGAFLFESGRVEEGLSYLDESIAGYERANAQPADLGGYLWWRASALTVLDRVADAQAALEKARSILSSLHDSAHPRVLRVRSLTLTLAVLSKGTTTIDTEWCNEAASIANDYTQLSQARPADSAFATFLSGLCSSPRDIEDVTKGALRQLASSIDEASFRMSIAKRVAHAVGN